MTDHPFLKGFTEEQTSKAFDCALRNAIVHFTARKYGPSDDVKAVLKECVEFENDAAFFSMAVGVTIGIIMMGFVMANDCVNCKRIGALHETVH